LSYEYQDSIIGAVKSSDTAATMAAIPPTLRSSEEEDFDDVEAEWKAQVYELAQSVTRLTKEHTVTNSTVDSLQSTMKELNSSVQAMMKSIGKMPFRESPPPSESLRQPSQVYPSLSERDGRFPLGYRSEGLNLASRESMLKKSGDALL